MEWYHADPKVGSGVMIINGSSVFTGEKDIELGRMFAETLKNEGMYVTVGYGDFEGEEAMEVRFTTEPNMVFM